MELSEGQFRQLVQGLSQPGSGAERRKAKRVAVVTRGTLRVIEGAPKRTFSVLTRDISATGMGLIAAAPIERGVVFSLELPDATGKGMLPPLHCQVRYCRTLADGMWGVGVEYIDQRQAPARADETAGLA